MSTESELREWRLGSTMAERLAAALLAIDGYKDISPQAPLGGADDRKDILASREGIKYVAAVYFPSTVQSFADIRAKYTHDREFLQAHGCDGFVFLTNQHLTLGNRATLISLGAPTDTIYDLQRIVTILDSPPGYGLRSSYLRITMTAEEQISFFDILQNQTILRRDGREREERRLLEEVAGRTLTLLDDIREIVVSSLGSDVVGDVRAPMGDLAVSNIALIHGIVLAQGITSSGTDGPFRAIPVWIADPTGGSLIAVCPPEEIVPELKSTLIWWRERYRELAANPIQEAVVDTLAEFHIRLARIHPFTDGNGRVIRFLLNKASEELLNRQIDRRLTEDRSLYYEALSEASAGSMERLKTLISAAIL